VLAQTQVDGLDLDAINKAAQAHARNLGPIRRSGAWPSG
jgi:conjugal transfer pilus assembly protein TrbC